MEEDIKILNDYLDENDRKFVKPKRLKFLQAIENLINKYKEQEKIIKLMTKYILKNCVSLEICSNQIGKECYIDVIYGDECKECVIEFFRKKAKGE